MAYALVGTIGTAVQGTSGGTASPLFGASESRTADNLLVLWVSVQGSATLPTTPTNWSIGAQKAGTSCSATVYYKIAAGADAAPVIGAITSGVIAAQLAEFSGNKATTPSDQVGTASGTTSPLTATFAAHDVTTGELWVACGSDFRSTARASNDTWTGTNVTPTAAGNNNGVSSVDHYSFAYDPNTAAFASADTAAMTLSITTSITGLAVAGVSFQRKAQSTSSSLGAVALSFTGPATRPTMRMTGRSLGSSILSFTGSRPALAMSRALGSVALSFTGAFAKVHAFGKVFTAALGFTGTRPTVAMSRNFGTAANDPTTEAWQIVSSGLSGSPTGVAYDGTYWVVAQSSGGQIAWATAPTGPWTLNAVASFNSVAYGNGYWVGVAGSGLLYYATNPTGSWTSNTQGAETFTDVAYGNGYWVAVSSTTGHCYYRATDPTGAWTLNTLTTVSADAVAYVGGYWVIVGGSGASPVLAYRATDPTGAFTTNNPYTPDASILFGVAYDGTHVAVTGSHGVYTATDPTSTWTLNANTTDSTYLLGPLGVKIAYGRGVWVSALSGRDVAVTAGSSLRGVGATTKLTNRLVSRSGPFTTRASGFGSNAVNAVEYGAGYYVAVGNAGNLAWSTDGVTWTLNTQGSSTFNEVHYDGSTYWVAVGVSGTLRYTTDPTGAWTANTQAGGFTGITYGGGNWVATQGGTTLYYAADPTGVWSTQTVAAFNDIAWDGTHYVAVGASGALRYATTPGGTWTSNPQGSTTFNSVAFGNGLWVAVGSSGVVYTAVDPTGAWTANAQGTTAWAAIAYGSGSAGATWVLAGASGAFLTTSDPTSIWTTRTSGASGFRATGVNDLIYGGGRWVGGGASGLLATATDPTAFNDAATGFVGSITRRANKALAAVLSFTGLVDAVKSGGTQFLQALAGSLDFVGVAVRSTSRLATATASFTGAENASTARTLTGSESFVGSTSRQTDRLLAGTSTLAGDIGRRTGRAVSAVADFAGTTSRSTRRAFAGAASFVGDLASGSLFAAAFTAVLTSSGSIARQIARPFAATLDVVGDLVTSGGRAVGGGIAALYQRAEQERHALARRIEDILETLEII